MNCLSFLFYRLSRCLFALSLKWQLDSGILDASTGRLLEVSIGLSDVGRTRSFSHRGRLDLSVSVFRGHVCLCVKSHLNWGTRSAPHARGGALRVWPCLVWSRSRNRAQTTPTEASEFLAQRPTPHRRGCRIVCRDSRGPTGPSSPSFWVRGLTLLSIRLRRLS